MAASHVLSALRRSISLARPDAERDEPLHLSPSLDEALAGGLGRGEVIEVASPGGLAGATSFALTACAAAQREARTLGSSAWCAWIDPSRTLYALGAEARDVDLARLLVATPTREALGRTAVRVAKSHVFSVVVVDASTLGSLDAWPNEVRRFSLAVEGTSTLVLLLTAIEARRALPLPAARRIELSRAREGELSLRIAKDRRGRVSGWRHLDWERAWRAA